MNDGFRKSNSEDNLVDEVVARLRDEYVPAVPRQLLENEPESGSIAPRQNPRASMAAWMIGIAAVVLAIVGIANMILPEHDKPNLSSNDSPVDIRDNIAKEPSKIHVQNLTSLRPFEGLDRELAEMKSEIEQLKMEAASLDAIRKLNAMMAQN